MRPIDRGGGLYDIYNCFVLLLYRVWLKWLIDWLNVIDSWLMISMNVRHVLRALQ